MELLQEELLSRFSDSVEVRTKVIRLIRESRRSGKRFSDPGVDIPDVNGALSTKAQKLVNKLKRR